MGDVDGVCRMARDDVDVLVRVLREVMLVVRIVVLMLMREGWGVRRRWRRGRRAARR